MISQKVSLWDWAGRGMGFLFLPWAPVEKNYEFRGFIPQVEHTKRSHIFLQIENNIRKKQPRQTTYSAMMRVLSVYE